MKKFFKRKLVWFVIIVIAVVVFVVRNKESEPLEFIEVERGDVVESVDVNGIYEPTVYANLSFEIAGEVSEVYMGEGASVEKGERIMKLTPTDIANELRLAENNLARVLEEEKLARRSTWDDLKPEQKDMYRIASEDARDRVANVKSKFRKIYVTSPLDGILVGIEPQVGEVVSPGMPVARVIQGEDFQITVDVSESDITKLRLGQNAVVTFYALGIDREFHARLVQIAEESTVIQGVIYYETIFELIETPKELLSGMSADLEVELDRRDGVLFIPEYLVEKDEGGEYVEVVRNAEESETERVSIQTGLEDTLGNIEILSGLQEGDKVLVR